MTQCWCCLVVTLRSRVKHWDRLFDSSPIKGGGILSVGLYCCLPASHPTLWIDKSLMNLYEILGFQPKGVATLSFSSRKRPAYAGMTGRRRLACLVVTPPCGYCLKASTSLRHGRIRQVLSVEFPCYPVVSRLRGNDGAVWAVVLDLMVLMVMCGKLCADSSILGFNRASDMYSFRGDDR